MTDNLALRRMAEQYDADEDVARELFDYWMTRCEKAAKCTGARVFVIGPLRVLDGARLLSRDANHWVTIARNRITTHADVTEDDYVRQHGAIVLSQHVYESIKRMFKARSLTVNSNNIHPTKQQINDAHPNVAPIFTTIQLMW